MPKRVRFQFYGWSQSTNNNNTKLGTMAEEQLTYFTCTLGEAAKWNENHPHPFETVNRLIDEQARELRQRPAVNFPGGCHDEEGREMKSGKQGVQRVYWAIRISRLTNNTKISRTESFKNTRWQPQYGSADGCK